MTPTDFRHEGDSWDLASSVGATLGEDGPLLTRRAMNEQIAVRTRFFDEFFVSA